MTRGVSYAEPRVVRDGETGWKVEILHRGRSISRLWITDRRMRIGAAVVRVGGIAGVGTDPAHRRRGLALRVLQRSLRLMADQGYETSLLFGIEDFYHRAGFATCMPEHGLSLAAADARRAVSPLKTRPMRPEDLAAVRRLYTAANAGRTASVVRGRGWQGFPMGSRFGVAGVARVVHRTASPGRLLGYFLYDDKFDYDDNFDRCRLAEVAGQAAEVHAAVLGFMARRAAALRLERITASVPVDHPFALYCRGIGARDETVYPRNGGPMGRIIDLPRFVSAMVPEWERRWPADGLGGIALNTDLGAVALRRRRDGRLEVGDSPEGAPRLRVPDQAVLFQLAMGYRSADDAAAAGLLRGSGAALEVARGLFPLRVAHMWWPDRF